jgi:hypothetical protein
MVLIWIKYFICDWQGTLEEGQKLSFLLSLGWMIGYYGYIELVSNVFCLDTHTHYIVLSLDNKIKLCHRV